MVFVVVWDICYVSPERAGFRLLVYGLIILQNLF